MSRNVDTEGYEKVFPALKIRLVKVWFRIYITLFVDPSPDERCPVRADCPEEWNKLTTIYTEQHLLYNRITKLLVGGMDSAAHIISLVLFYKTLK